MILAVILLLTAVTAIYFSQYYKPGDKALEILLSDCEGVTVDTSIKGYISFIPDVYTSGIILYPGAKVDAKAYAPLMYALAEKGILSVICEMPLNFALTKTGAYRYYVDAFPDDVSWYVMGHSLGGVAASSYLPKDPDGIDGIIFLASYTSTDISSLDVKVLSVYGTEDTVLNKDAYEKGKDLLPSSSEEYVIIGGNHAQFGDYGRQKGDGTAVISSELQTEETVGAILRFIEN